MDFQESFHPLQSQAPDAYTEAVEAYCHGILRLHWNERLINKIFGRALQSHAAGRLVVQHFQWQREGADRPTLALLQRQAGRGARTLATFFAVLRLAGMVSAEPDARDRRVRYLVPGPRLLDGLRTWVIHHLQCAEALGVLPSGHAARLGTDADYFEAFLCRAGTILDRLAEHRGRFGGWDWFDQREGGGRVAMLLMREHCRTSPTLGGGAAMLFPLRAQELAERLGFSHSHVRNLVNDATAAGLLTQDAQRGLVALTPRFEADLRHWLKHLLGWFAEAAQAASRSAPPATHR
jgi:AraC-like DNA-binding protein